MSSPPPAVVPPEMEWDDELWDLIWERRLDQVERHHLGWSILRGRLPDAAPFEAAIGRELALRWQRTLRYRMLLWATWCAFWAIVVIAAAPEPWGVPAAMVVVGVLVIGLMLWSRRRMARVVREADRRIREAKERRDEGDEGPTEYTTAA